MPQWGSRFDRIMAGVFPAGIMFAVLLLMSVAGWAISLSTPDHEWNWAIAIPVLGLWMTGYTILTAIALLLGVATANRIQKT